MIEIFKQYKDLGFVLLYGKTKSPIKTAWQNNPETIELAQKHLKSGKNYGVLGGYGGLIIIDADKVTTHNKVRQQKYDEELILILEKEFPETLTIQSGSGARHYYFFCPELKNKIVLQSKRDGIDLHWGEVMSYGSQVVGPGSIHPETGKEYTILKEKPIATISGFKLNILLSDFLISVQESKETSFNEKQDGIDNLRVSNIWSTNGLKKISKQLCGSHPIHGSSTGLNFTINENNNVWHCFRCNSGGGPASAIAVKHGIISCHEAKSGGLTGEKFKEVIKIAVKEYGLDNKPLEITKFEDIKKIQDNYTLNLWTFTDYLNMEVDNNFIVNKMIYPKSITMFYSPPGEFKSIMSVDLALALALGKPFLGFETKQNAVLYCDKENNDKIIRERLMAIYKGHQYKDTEMPLYFLRREGDLKDSIFLKKLFYNIEKYNIKIVFFDTMHRFGDYDENSANDVNSMYVNVFSPLIEKYGCSIIFLHHTNKDGSFRGSGDFLGMVDTSYKFKRLKGPNNVKSNKFLMINDKNRSGEIEQVEGEIIFDNAKDSENNEILDCITILLDNGKTSKSENKTQRVINIIKNETTNTSLLTRKDYLAIVINQMGEEISESTIKEALRWLINKEMLIRDERNRYKKNIKLSTYEQIDTIDMSDD